MQARGWLVLAAGSLLLLAGCGPPKQVGESRTPSSGGEEEYVDPGDEEMESDVPDPDKIEFDEEQAKVVMKRGAKKAAECKKVTDDVPSGEGDVEVVFDGPSGKIVDVILGSNFGSGSDMASNCIKRAFIGEIIPPFKGQKTVPFTFTMP